MKKILAMLLCLCMVISLTPTAAFAAGELPDATVSKLEAMTLTASEHDYMVWPSGDDSVDRPLQIVMNFKANETLAQAQEGQYGKFVCDFYLTLKNMTNESITADGCYLAGNYGEYGWIVIPADGMELKNEVTYPIVSAYDANLTYENICDYVKDFTAAIYIDEEILKDNPAMTVTLELKMTDPENAENVLVVGEPAVYTVGDLLGDNCVASVTNGESTEYYADLAAAIDAAEAGDTVTLLKNVTATEITVIDKGITLDGNGKTLTSSAARAINVKTEGKVTIQNLTINASGERAINVITYPAELTIDNVTASGASYAVNVASTAGAAKIAITDSNLSGNIVLNVWNANGTINVTDSVLAGVDKAEVESYSTVKLNNDGTNAAEGTVININGGSVTAEDDSFAVMNQTQTGKVNISNTTSVTGETKLFPEYSTLVIYEGSTHFYACASLQDAIDTASETPETASVRLTADVELTATVTNPNGVTIDLNGFEIKAAAGYTLTVSDDGKTYTVSVYVPPYVPPVVEPDPEPEVPEIEAPTVDTSAPVVDSTTTENEDGSTTKNETLENGTKVETTTNTDGSFTSTATKSDTVESEEGKTTTTTTVTTNTSASGEVEKESKQEVKEEKADGSATTTTTTVTETEKKTEKTEVKEETVVKEDGTTETTSTSTTETALSNGSTGTTTVAADRTVTAEVTVSKAAASEAAASSAPIELAMPAVEAAKTSDETAAAATVTVSLPKGTESATVAIPVAEGTGAGAVAVIVNADGTETIVSDSKVTENGLEVEVPNGAVIKVVDNSADFGDINDGDWEKDAVDFTSSRNIMNGVGGDSFAPDTTTTRAMVWTMLARYAGVDTTTGETWDEVGRQWAMENGISDGTMADEEVTREQLVTMIWRFLGEADSDHDISHFEDHGDTSDWALIAKQWAVEMGIISGVGQADGTVTLDPKGDASRAQVAQIFYNFITKA